MFGKTVIAYCPTCKKYKQYDLGRTVYMQYKNKEYAFINCYDCNTSFIGDTIESSNVFYNQFRHIEDNTKIGLIYEIMEFISNKYNESSSEDIIEKETFQYVINTIGEDIAYKNEYEIKYVIQLIISDKFHNPLYAKLKSYLYKNVQKEVSVSKVFCY